MKKINQILATAAFTAFLPLIAAELLIKNPHDIVARVKLSFQLMLFVVNLGNQKR